MISTLKDELLKRNQKFIFFGNSHYPVLGMETVIPQFNSYAANSFSDEVQTTGSHIADHNGDFVTISNRLLENWSGDPTKTIALFLMYNNQTTSIVKKLGMIFGHTDANLYQFLENKRNGIEIAKACEVPILPSTYLEGSNYCSFASLIDKYGQPLFVQEAVGSSGKSTYSISTEKQWRDLFTENPKPWLKVSSLLNGVPLAVEACVTREGCVVGPVLSELIGHASLTPFAFGWCGNQLFTKDQNELICRQLRSSVERIGGALKKLNFLGLFSVDFIFDLKSNQFYFSEINPRITGASTITNLLLDSSEIPSLLLLHACTFSSPPIFVPVREINALIQNATFPYFLSQLIWKNTGSKRQIDINLEPKNYDFNCILFKGIQSKIPSCDFCFYPEIAKNDWLGKGQEIGNFIASEPLYDHFNRTIEEKIFNFIDSLETRLFKT